MRVLLLKLRKPELLHHNSKRENLKTLVGLAFPADGATNAC
jgi:hypothetical protein